MDDAEKRDKLIMRLGKTLNESLENEECKMGHCLAALSDMLCILVVENDISEKLFLMMMEVGYLKILDKRKEIENKDSENGT